MRPCLAGSFLLSILLSASASLAQGQPPPAAPQPPPGYAVPQLPPGYAVPQLPPGYAMPYYPVQPQLGPRTIKWNEGELVPPGYHKSSEIRTGLVIGGSVMFGVAWVPTAVVCSFGAPLGIIPVVGPFILAGQAASTNGDDDSGANGAGGVVAFWLVFDGLQQAAGLGMLIAGLVARQPILVRDDVREAKAKTWWMPIPMTFGRESAGVGFVGTM